MLQNKTKMCVDPTIFKNLVIDSNQGKFSDLLKIALVQN